MTLADRVFQPFETLVKPLDIKITELPDHGPVRLVWHFAKMFRGVLIAVGLLSVISALIGLSVVWTLAYVVDGVVESGATLFIQDNLLLLFGFAVLLAVIDPLATFIESCFSSQTIQTLLPSAMRWQAHKAVEKQDVAFFEDLYAGQVASRIEQVARAVQSQLVLSIKVVPQFFVQFIGSLSLLLLLAWPLAIPVAIWILLNVVFAWKILPVYKEKSAKVAEASSRATGAMTDVYSNIAMVKAFSAESSEGDAIREVIRETIDTQHQESRYYILTETFVRLTNAFLAVAIFGIGLWGMVAGFVSVGDFVAAATITRSLFNISFAFIGLGQAIFRSLGTISDAMPVITSKPEVFDKPDAVPFEYKQGEIRFENISYSYANKKYSSDDEEEQKTIISNLKLMVSPGEKVGLVGLSGAGKSTLISLLLRLRDVDQGVITIDGQNIREVKQASLRKEIGVVTQDVLLFNRSIRDNIRYGAVDATDSQIEQAAALAEASEFIAELKDGEGRVGLDAHVGDRGVKLSGGQRQRLAIARVILKDARILLLDEATSALDSEAEAEIQANLENLMHNKTTFAIAHRLSTISRMDRLLVLNDGKIVEEGTHEHLVSIDGLYAKLWSRQSGGFIATRIEV